VRFLKLNSAERKEERIVLYIYFGLEGLRLKERKRRKEVNKTQKLWKIMNAEETSNFLSSLFFFLGSTNFFFI